MLKLQRIGAINFLSNKAPITFILPFIKKSAKLCHPDIVANKFKEKAHKIMQKPNEAYGKQDLFEVKRIFDSLNFLSLFI